MFEGLDQTSGRGQPRSSAVWTRLGQWAAVFVLAAALFSALVLAMHFLE